MSSPDTDHNTPQKGQQVAPHFFVENGAYGSGGGLAQNMVNNSSQLVVVVITHIFYERNGLFQVIVSDYSSSVTCSVRGVGPVAPFVLGATVKIKGYTFSVVDLASYPKPSKFVGCGSCHSLVMHVDLTKKGTIFDLYTSKADATFVCSTSSAWASMLHARMHFLCKVQNTKGEKFVDRKASVDPQDPVYSHWTRVDALDAAGCPMSIALWDKPHVDMMSDPAIMAHLTARKSVFLFLKFAKVKDFSKAKLGLKDISINVSNDFWDGNKSPVLLPCDVVLYMPDHPKFQSILEQWNALTSIKCLIPSPVLEDISALAENNYTWASFEAKYRSAPQSMFMDNKGNSVDEKNTNINNNEKSKNKNASENTARTSTASSTTTTTTTANKKSESTKDTDNEGTKSRVEGKNETQPVPDSIQQAFISAANASAASIVTVVKHLEKNLIVPLNSVTDVSAEGFSSLCKVNEKYGSTILDEVTTANQTLSTIRNQLTHTNVLLGELLKAIAAQADKPKAASTSNAISMSHKTSKVPNDVSILPSGSSPDVADSQHSTEPNGDAVSSDKDEDFVSPGVKPSSAKKRRVVVGKQTNDKATPKRRAGRPRKGDAEGEGKAKAEKPTPKKITVARKIDYEDEKSEEEKHAESEEKEKDEDKDTKDDDDSNDEKHPPLPGDLFSVEDSSIGTNESPFIYPSDFIRLKLPAKLKHVYGVLINRSAGADGSTILHIADNAIVVRCTVHGDCATVIPLGQKIGVYSPRLVKEDCDAAWVSLAVEVSSFLSVYKAIAHCTITSFYRMFQPVHVLHCAPDKSCVNLLLKIVTFAGELRSSVEQSYVQLKCVDSYGWEIYSKLRGWPAIQMLNHQPIIKSRLTDVGHIFVKFMNVVSYSVDAKCSFEMFYTKNSCKLPVSFHLALTESDDVDCSALFSKIRNHDVFGIEQYGAIYDMHRAQKPHVSVRGAVSLEE